MRVDGVEERQQHAWAGVLIPLGIELVVAEAPSVGEGKRGGEGGGGKGNLPQNGPDEAAALCHPPPPTMTGQELLDDNGILPILSSDVSEASASLASAVESLSDTISGASGVAATGSSAATGPPSAGSADATGPGARDELGDVDSWEKGVAIFGGPSERRRVEAGVGTGTSANGSELDEVEVIMQVR